MNQRGSVGSRRLRSIRRVNRTPHPHHLRTAYYHYFPNPLETRRESQNRKDGRQTEIWRGLQRDLLTYTDPLKSKLQNKKLEITPWTEKSFWKELIRKYPCSKGSDLEL